MLEWDAPLADGGSPVTAYEYIAQEHATSSRTWSTTNGARWVSTAGTATSVTVTERGNGKALEGDVHGG